MSDPITVDGLSEDENALANRLLDELERKAQRNLLRASYYDGKRAITQVGSVIPPQYYRLGVVLGWSGKAVDILARRCNLDGFVWPDGSLDDLGFRELVEGNNLFGELSGAIVSSLIHGPVFLINTRGLEGEPESLIHVKDAMNATGTWNPRTRRLDDCLSVTRRVDGQPVEFVLYLSGVTVTCGKEAGGWRVLNREEHPWRVPAEVMAYKQRPGRPFGSSRISRAVMSLHDMALRTVIRMEGHADVYSFPEMLLLGADESIFKDQNGNLKPAWQVMLGRIKAIPDDDTAANPRVDVKHFTAASPEPHILQLKQQAQLFSGETSIPLTSLGVSDMSNPASAESYIASREDLIAEAEGATDDWTAPIARSCIRGLAILNGLDEVPDQWATIAPKWRSPMHLSRAAQADAGAKQLATVPWLAETEVGLELLGLSEQQIERAMAERRRMSGSEALRAIVEAAQARADGQPVPQ